MAMRIEAIPLLADNYAWLITRPGEAGAAVVDPSEAGPVADVLRGRGLELELVLATHHHHDHVGGIDALLQMWPRAQVVGSRYDLEQQRVPGQTMAVDPGQTVSVLGEACTCIAVPGHTLGAVTYHLTTSGAAFTGDTLFLAGCGRLFEGTPAQMFASLTSLAALPPSTRIYCGHEYTEKSLRFGASVLPGDTAIAQRAAQVAAQRARGEPTVPAPLAEELRTNLFLRAADAEVAAAVGKQPGLETFTELRARRDRF